MSLKTKRSDKEIKEIKLTDALSNLTTTIIRVKASMDETSLDIAKKYAKDNILSNLPLPFFTISEVNLQLKMAINGVDKSKSEFSVLIDADTLEKLPQHAISEIGIKLLPVSGKLYRTDEGSINIS